MLKNYLKVALRSLWNNKWFSLINISGLALGLTCSLLIILWVRDEQQVDTFLNESSRLYTLYTRSYYDKKVSGGYSTPALLPDEIKKKIPEIEYSTGFTQQGPNTFRVGEKSIKESGVEGGADFFSVFSYPLLQGTAASALSSPLSISISRQMAEAFFGSPQEAIGQTIRFEEQRDFKVSAVFEDIPDNASQKFDFVLNWFYFLEANTWAPDWTNIGPRTYIKLRPGSKADRVGEKITHFLDNYDKRSGTASFRIELYMQPFGDTYLHSTFKDGKIAGGRIEYVRIFSVVAVFILLIACINFMNLTTARSVKRAKEIGVRKVSGSSRLLLIMQFIGEAVLLALMAMFLALGLLLLLLPVFNGLTGKSIHFPAGQLFFWIALIVLTMMTGLISGSYPAFFLSSFNPVNIMKGSFRVGSGAAWLRKTLVVFQFALSIMLIIGMAVISRQVNYIQSNNLGYDRENLIYIPMDGALKTKFQVFKEKAMQMTSIKSVSCTSQVPLIIQNGTSEANWDGKDASTNPRFAYLSAGYDFTKTMDIQLVAGRDFSREYLDDSTVFILNESAVKVMDYKDPVGRYITFKGQRGKIIGVVKDFHFASMHDPIRPLIVTLLSNEDHGTILVRTGPGATKPALGNIEDLCKQLNPEFPFTYLFADQLFGRLYKSELLVDKLSDCFAVLAIFISCIGLLGLAIFTAEQRAKEIGIRKVLGAGTGSLFGLLSREFLVLVLLAFVIAAPAAWFIMSRWLQDYAYKVDVPWWVFAATGLIILLIALATVSFQSVKAALANPVRALRSE